MINKNEWMKNGFKSLSGNHGHFNLMNEAGLSRTQSLWGLAYKLSSNAWIFAHYFSDKSPSVSYLHTNLRKAPFYVGRLALSVVQQSTSL